jgi:predicted RNase H-like nuclease (RuvC/YqgF family)
METSIAGVVGFLEDNDNLIKQLMETAESASQEISDLSVQVDHAREEAKELVDQLGAVEFEVGKQDETKVRQKALLEAVETLRKKFETYKNDPLRRGIYAAEISNLYLQLANTFNNGTIAQIVPFTRDEIKTYKELMKEAVLDGASRKKRAAVIKAAAKISKLAIGIAGKLA